VVWVAEIPEDDVEVDVRRGEASLRARHICVFDSFTVPNALTANHPAGFAKAVIHSLRLEWSGVLREVADFTNVANRFAGTFVENTATIQVSVSTFNQTGTTFTFVSDPANTSVSHFAQIGRERNGEFF
jgi:hypothetical protein